MFFFFFSPLHFLLFLFFFYLPLLIFFLFPLFFLLFCFSSFPFFLVFSLLLSFPLSFSHGFLSFSFFSFLIFVFLIKKKKKIILCPLINLPLLFFLVLLHYFLVIFIPFSFFTQLPNFLLFSPALFLHPFRILFP